ncbi:MAG: hypothetical protein KF689_10010 [Gemmatimonadaceae bacterium]|nr:hypothetical protein [Gemmatimonadaceae bacterium]MCW5826066.1 hypothetical protein [Gemmatimonadaceae bacterium]
MQTPPSLSRLLLVQGLGLLRWSQTVPMLVAWAAVWTILAAFAFVNFQEEGVTLVSGFTSFLERVPGVPDPSSIGHTDASGAFVVDDAAFRRVALSYWTTLSLLLYLLGFALRTVRGERPPIRLRSKLMAVAVVAVLTLLAFVEVFRNSTVPIHGSTSSWLMMFGGLVALAVGASAYSLTVGHLLDRLCYRLSA